MSLIKGLHHAALRCCGKAEMCTGQGRRDY